MADAQGVIELAKERFTKSLWNMKSRLLTVRVDAFDYPAAALNCAQSTCFPSRTFPAYKVFHCQ
ncbi:hypothetical protein [Bradyrhizobium sp. sBnM-33]|uniref:hypothetical protein n=1 Tax=Bradyrhizobium sp. sBnM-33 TaxID=2831780 RepID=UPI001BCB1AA2|nr:hypothetical protein [Bradyrhizobium sp. sBnM-33]WOH50137.1 hypothetical protein RX328_39895 [Bradyrhizobium sp. sBnM-33]